MNTQKKETISFIDYELKQIQIKNYLNDEAIENFKVSLNPWGLDPALELKQLIVDEMHALSKFYKNIMIYFSLCIVFFIIGITFFIVFLVLENEYNLTIRAYDQWIYVFLGIFVVCFFLGFVLLFLNLLNRVKVWNLERKSHIEIYLRAVYKNFHTIAWKYLPKPVYEDFLSFQETKANLSEHESVFNPNFKVKQFGGLGISLMQKYLGSHYLKTTVKNELIKMYFLDKCIDYWISLQKGEPKHVQN